jgi:hypothetical protein
MKKTLILALVMLWNSIAIGAVSLRVCEADGNTPFDSNTPVMVGVKLTIYVDSNSATSMWLGGLDFIQPSTNPDPPLGRLFGRGWDAQALDWVDSHFSAAGNRAKIVDWENQDQQSFELHANGLDMADGTWFVIDYNAMNIGDCTIDLVGYQDSNLVTVQSKTLHQVASRDFNNDGQVNFIDFSKLASYWLHTDCNELNDCEGTDLNPVPDGTIDYLDVMYFADFWLGRFGQLDSGVDAALLESSMMESSSMAFLPVEQQASDEQQLSNNAPPIYLTCDTNTPVPNQEVTVYVHTDTPLLCMGVGTYLVGDATITSAMSKADCNNFGWDNGWNCEPYIDPNGYVSIGGVRWVSDANGTVGYFKFRYHSGQISLYVDQENSTAYSWDGTSCSQIPFSQEILLIGRDPDEP